MSGENKPEHDPEDYEEITCASCAYFGTDACIRLNTEEDDEICDMYLWEDEE